MMSFQVGRAAGGEPPADRSLGGFMAAHAKPAMRDEPARRPPGEVALASRGGALGSPVYNQHGYWSKKPYGGIEACIGALSRPGEVVLDPFCGSGSTLVV